MIAATAIGTVASLASIISFAPQAWRIIKTRDAHSIAAATYALTVGAFAAWTCYGILLGEWPLIVTNSVCLVLSSFILMMKLLPRHARDEVADALDPAVRSSQVVSRAGDQVRSSAPSTDSASR